MNKVSASLEAVSTGLAAKPWCTGIHMTLADVAVGCALGYLDVPLPADRLARRLPEPGAPCRQAQRAQQLHRHGATARLTGHAAAVGSAARSGAA